MKPFIFQFSERGVEEGYDLDLIEYNKELNLNIEKESGFPAIKVLDLSTETFTKTENEVSDSDNNYLNRILETETLTAINNEDSDSDNNNYRKIKQLMETTTATRDFTEVSDTDY
ncbi:hypothetical protein [Sphingobacterium multivorum]|uniref:hypothetical protein n=1 Tax=Sphingobacterium multivorum TaxID=28454 RepID=UPI0028A6EE00|nr:hypothetical protein [Sphingobacterium multivorum]